MKNNKKYIGINQHIPFQVLDHAVYMYLKTKKVAKQDILRHVHEFISGSNRAEKAALNTSLIIKRQSYILDAWLESHKPEDWSVIQEIQRKAMLICLLCLTFPIAYHLLVSLAPALKVHQFITRKSMNTKIAALYGNNRTVHIAMGALIQIFTGFNILQRQEIGKYLAGKNLSITNQFIQELIFLAEIHLSGSKSLLLEDYTHRPWFHYFNVPDFNTKSLKLLKIIPSEHNINYLMASKK